MKKVFAFVLALVMLASVSAVSYASDTGIQMIGGPSSAGSEESVDLDNFKVGQIAHIDGLGDVEFISAEWIDSFSSPGYLGDNYRSGEEAEYLRLTIRILNTNKKEKNYLTMINDVLCEYGDGYVFKGWVRQKDKDTDDAQPFDKAETSYDISPLYAGRYIICVTMPNLCVNSDEPLSVSFKIGSSEFTYIYHE